MVNHIVCPSLYFLFLQTPKYFENLTPFILLKPHFGIPYTSLTLSVARWPQNRFYWSCLTLHYMQTVGAHSRIPIRGAEWYIRGTLRLYRLFPRRRRPRRHDRDLSHRAFWNSDETTVAVSELQNGRQGSTSQHDVMTKADAVVQVLELYVNRSTGTVLIGHDRVGILACDEYAKLYR